MSYNINTPLYSVNLSVGVYIDINIEIINNERNIGTPHYSINLSVGVYTDINNIAIKHDWHKC